MYSDTNLGIFVMNMEDYLNNFFVDHSNIHDLYESLASLLAEAQEKGERK